MREQDLREALEDLSSQAPDKDLVGAARRRARRTRRWHAALAAAAAVVLVVAGVAVVPQLVGLSSPLAVSSGGNTNSGEEKPPFATYRPTGATFAALIEKAKLVLNDGCVYVITPPASPRPLIFPTNTTWDPARQQITLDDSTVSIGDQVHVGGGSVAASDADYIPPSCRYDHNSDRPFWEVGSIGKVQPDG